MSDTSMLENEGEHLLYFYRKLSNSILDILRDLTDDELNRHPPAAMCNSLYAIAYHAASAAYWWMNVAGGNITERDKPGEFRASGTFATIEERFQLWLHAAEEVIARLKPVDYEKVHELPSGSQTTRQALFRTLEHLALHLGQIEITKQWLEQDNRTASIH